MKAQQKSKKKLPEINTTALPDIIFMLLFFFMVSTVIKKDNNDLPEVPKVYFTDMIERDDVSVLAIKLENDEIKYIWNNQSYSSIKSIKKALERKKADQPIDHIKLAAEASLSMKCVNEVKEMLQELEIYKVDYLALQI